MIHGDAQLDSEVLLSPSLPSMMRKRVDEFHGRANIKRRHVLRQPEVCLRKALSHITRPRKDGAVDDTCNTIAMNLKVFGVL